MFRKLRLLASCISMAVAVTTGGLALAQNPASPQAPAAPAPAAPAVPAPQAAVPLTDLVSSPQCCDVDQGCCDHGHHGCVFTPQMIGDGLNFVSGSAPPGTTALAAP